MHSRLFLLTAALTGALAQSPTSPQKEFDIISVKPSAPDEHNSFMTQNLPGGSLRMAGVPLKMLMMRAYDVRAFQISGEPDWVRTDRWDIVAKAEGVEGRLTPVELRPMLQALMASRFHLKIHREIKEMPVYQLAVAKNGTKLAVHTDTEQQFRTGKGSLTVKKGGTAALATWLSQSLGRVVIDKTDLAGEYDYSLEWGWMPDSAQSGPESMGLPPEAQRPPTDTNGVSIFTALQEQLGLRLVSSKGPVEVIVIDRVERASGN